MINSQPFDCPQLPTENLLHIEVGILATLTCELLVINKAICYCLCEVTFFLEDLDAFLNLSSHISKPFKGLTNTVNSEYVKSMKDLSVDLGFV